MSEPLYYILVENRETGPYPLARLQEMWKTGMVSAETLFWKQGQAGWEPLSKISSTLGQTAAQDLRQLLPPSSVPASSRVPSGIIPPDGAVAAPRSGTSGLAIASFVCGLAGLFLGIPALLAIPLGHISRREIKRSAGVLRGGGLALTGLILGYLVLGVFAAVSGFVALVDHHRGPAIADLVHARQIGSAVLRYAGDHQGRTPAEFGVLMPTYIADNTVFISPLSADNQSLGYELVLPDADVKAIKDPAHTVLVRGRYKTSQGFRAYVYADGHGAAQRE